MLGLLLASDPVEETKYSRLENLIAGRHDPDWPTAPGQDTQLH